MAPSPRSLAVAVVLLHHGILVLHAVAHEVLAIALTAFQQAYVAGVVVAAPLGGALLLFTRFRRVGAALLGASMLGALGFGLASHALLPGPDNVFEVGTGGGGALFQATGVLLSITEAAGTWVGARLVRAGGASQRTLPGPTPGEDGVGSS